MLTLWATSISNSIFFEARKVRPANYNAHWSYCRWSVLVAFLGSKTHCPREFVCRSSGQPAVSRLLPATEGNAHSQGTRGGAVCLSAKPSSQTPSDLSPLGALCLCYCWWGTSELFVNGFSQRQVSCFLSLHVCFASLCSWLCLQRWFLVILSLSALLISCVYNVKHGRY